MAQKDGEGRNPHAIMPGEKSHLFFFFQENETCLVSNSPGPAEIEDQSWHAVTIQF